MRVLGAVEWAELHLDALRPVLEDLARTLGTALQAEMESELDAEARPADPMAAIMPMLTPVLLGLQAGSMIGYLALHALGRYDLPLPAADTPSLCFVAAHIDDFEEAWSLPRADLRFTLATHEVVHAAVRSVPWVGERLVRLASEYVRAYHLDLGRDRGSLRHARPERPAVVRGARRPSSRDPRCDAAAPRSTRCRSGCGCSPPSSRATPTP